FSLHSTQALTQVSPLSLHDALPILLTPDGAPLSGVTIKVKGTARQTSTKDDGRYSIAVSPRDVLVYTSVGYVEQERVVSSEDKRSEEHTSELQSRENLVCRLLLEKK